MLKHIYNFIENMSATLYSKNLMHPPHIHTLIRAHTHTGSASLELGSLDGAGSESPLALTDCQGDRLYSWILTGELPIRIRPITFIIHSEEEKLKVTTRELQEKNHINPPGSFMVFRNRKRPPKMG